MNHVKMPKELADKWLAGLRSGEYKQGLNYLERVDDQGNARYCCLGVLQMVADGKVQAEREEDGEELPTGEWLIAHGVAFYGSWGQSACCNPYLPSLSRTAASANDSGYDFCAIARAIEETLETY